MKKLAFMLTVLALVAPSEVFAASSRAQQMEKLSPETRIEQRCDSRAMGEVSRSNKGFKPDEFVAYAFADPVLRGSRISAPGGAVRSGGKWYRVSYVCETTSDGMEIKSFAHQLGAEVPRSEWDAHFLVAR